MTHRHHTAGRALRLVLANYRKDIEAERILIEEIDGCGWCWFLVAEELAGFIDREIGAAVRERGLTAERVEAHLAALIADQLDADGNFAA